MSEIFKMMEASEIFYVPCKINNFIEKLWNVLDLTENCKTIIVPCCMTLYLKALKRWSSLNSTSTLGRMSSFYAGFGRPFFVADVLCFWNTGSLGRSSATHGGASRPRATRATYPPRQPVSQKITSATKNGLGEESQDFAVWWVTGLSHRLSQRISEERCLWNLESLVIWWVKIDTIKWVEWYCQYLLLTTFTIYDISIKVSTWNS